MLSVGVFTDAVQMRFLPSLAAWLLVPASLFALNPPTPNATPSPVNFDADRSALIQGIGELGAPGAPGGVCVFGPQAFAVIAGKDGKKALLPVVAAARWEKGRVVALGHNGYLGAFDSG